MQHRKPRIKRAAGQVNLNMHVAMLCRPCHKFVHSVLTEKELAEDFGSVERLRAHPAIERFVHWVGTKPAGLRVRTRRPHPT